MKYGKSRGLVSPSKGGAEGVCCSAVSAGKRDSAGTSDSCRVAGSLRQASDCCVTVDAIVGIGFSSTYDD